MIPSIRSLAVAASLTLAASANAQVGEVQPGSRIRFTGQGVGSRVTAMVLERHGDTLRVIRGNSAAPPFDVRMSELSTLRISGGRSRAAGAGVGALWGAGINAGTVMLLVAAGAECEGCETEIDGPAVGLSLVSGALTGALIGALIGREQWNDVSLPMRASVRPTLARELLAGGETGQRLGVKVKFSL